MVRVYNPPPAWDGTIVIELSAPQESPLGKIVGDLFYNTRLLEMVKHTGYPHNGGEHTLSIYGQPKDLIAFLELVIERFLPFPKYSEGIAKIKEIIAFVEDKFHLNKG